ncbi:hypothetical protein N7540_000152 [Penicillium herquei]|nr:hypothetical protein N7540_000152 [Penicillium herquei]
MQAALADIPKRLSIIQRLSDLYIESPKLHEYRLSRSLGDKLLQKVNGRASDVQGALDNMSTAIDDYRAEADYCAQLRIGRIEEEGKELNSKYGSLVASLNGMGERMNGLQEAILRFPDKEKGRKDGSPNEEEMQTMLYNVFYYLFASDPEFNTKNGTVVRSETQNFPLAGRTKSLAPKNIPVVNSWLEGFRNFDLTSHREINDHLFQMGAFDSNEQDQMHYIINSDSIVDWLNSVESGVLDITAETAPDKLFNPISASSAMLAFLLEYTKAWAVLSFFCSLKPTDEYHGPVALVNCLNGQLLRFMVREKLEVDLSFLKKKKYGKRTRDEQALAMGLMGKLLSMLPDGQVVFIIVDSLSRLSGDGKEVKAMIKMLDKEARVNSNLILKVLLTDPLQNCLPERLSTLSLHVPDEVDKWQCGIPRSILEKEAKALVARFRHRHDQFNTNSSGREEESEEESEEEGNDFETSE